jgi:pimeloyl-ACP methyl ester carboxylesterase
MRLATHRPPGLVLTDHRFTVTLDHGDPGGETIEIFAREMVAPARERDELPWLLFLQGGPGFESPRPLGRDVTWKERALADWRILLLDQRGTGRSTPQNRRTLAALETPQRQADYLAHFRADNIVRDAESIRRELAGDEVQWDVIGQSYGGFCIATYLSIAPEGVRTAYVTGGLPPLERTPDEVYRALFPRVEEKNRRYFDRYPGDGARLRAIAETLRAEDVRLPGGDPLPPERLQCLGLVFGMSDGFERVHYLVEEAFPDDGERPTMTDRFLSGVEAATGFEANPLYALLHEPIYCQGTAGRWAAHRVRGEFPAFAADADRFLFTGEMIFPWMFEQHESLRPLQEAGELLASRDDWPALYDRARLGGFEGRSSAVIYHDDMYVDATASLDTAASIAGMRWWVTNEFEHDGARVEGKRLFDRLVDLASGEA